MASDDWKRELKIMMDAIGRQSTMSLEKIKKHFQSFGLPFDEAFRQNVMKLANLQ